MTTPKQVLTLSEVELAKLQAAVLPMMNNLTVMDNYGNILHVNHVTEITLGNIELDDGNFVIECNHNDPVYESPMILTFPKKRIGMYFEDDIASILLKGEQA